MQKLTDMLEVPVVELYKHMIGQSEAVLPFELNSNRDEEPSLTWKLFNTCRDLHRDYWYDISHMCRCLLF